MLRAPTSSASTAAATAKYYTKYLTQAPGEQAGVWAGAQAGGLGLSGEVSTDALELLLSGHDHAVTLDAAGRHLELVTRRNPLQTRILNALGIDTTSWDQAHIH
jgi:hypothetical protein